MKPIDFRNETFLHLKARHLAGLREKVWLAWIAYEIRHGTAGATTRQVAATSEIDLLTFRPRSTELYQIGALKLAETNPAPASSGEDTGEGGPQTPSRREGLYVLRSQAEWEAWHAEQFALATGRQQQLI